MVNVGVVDYTIASPEYLKHITNFQVLEFSKLLSDVHCPICIVIDHVKQYSCMRSSPNIMGDDSVDKNHAGGKILIKVLFLENLDLELMNDLENSVVNLSPKISHKLNLFDERIVYSPDKDFVCSKRGTTEIL